MQKYKGYHTTKKEYGEKIIKSGVFLSSSGNKEWLGEGVYFWKNKYTAKQFWPGAHNIESSDVFIIEADLITGADRVLDLDEEDQFNNFVEFCRELKEQLIESKNNIPLENEKEKWCFYSNYFKKIYKINIIKRTFSHPKRESIYSVNRLQYCVSDFCKKDVIKNIKEVV